MRHKHLFTTLAFILLVAGTIQACTGISATHTASPTTSLSSGQPTPANGDGPVEVVSAFLDSLIQDPSGENSKQYLSQSLREDVAANHPIADILRIKDIYRSYGISDSSIEQDRNRAFVQVGLNYGSPVLRDFVLTHRGGSWLINTIISYSIPSPNVSPYYLDANKTILDYVQALDDNQPAAAWDLLQADTQLILNKSELSTQVSAIRTINIVAMNLYNDDTDRLLYQVLLWVNPKSGQKSEWQDGRNERWIELVNTEGGWRIQQISDIALD